MLKKFLDGAANFVICKMKPLLYSGSDYYMINRLNSLDKKDQN